MLFLRRDGNSPYGKACGAFDSGPCGKEDGAGWGDFIKVCHDFDLYFVMGEDVPFAGEVSHFCRFHRCVSVESFVAVCGSISGFVDILERGDGPARAMFSAIFADPGEFVSIRPVFAPVCAEGNEGGVWDGAVFGFVGFDVFWRHGVVDVGFDFFCDVDHAEGVCHVFHAKAFRVRFSLDEVAGKVDVRAKLPRKFEGLDLAFENGIAPIEDGFSDFKHAFRHTGPDGGVVVYGMGEFDPVVVFLAL